MPQQEVYADLYFFINASMDLLCLNLTAALLHSRPPRWRLFLGAALGGLFSVAVLLFGVGGVAELALDALAACGICAVAFARRGGKLRRGKRAGADGMTIPDLCRPCLRRRPRQHANNNNVKS